MLQALPSEDFGVIVMVSARTGLNFCDSWEGVWPYYPMSLPGAEERDPCFPGEGVPLSGENMADVEWFSICFLLGVSLCFHFFVLYLLLLTFAVIVNFLVSLLVSIKLFLSQPLIFVFWTCHWWGGRKGSSVWSF